MLEKSNEMQYLRALQNGDENAFTVLYNEYWDLLFGVAYNTTRSRDVAQEIVQDVFLSLWAGRRELRIQTTVKAYLCGAVRHGVFNYFDKQSVRDKYKMNVAAKATVATNITEEQIAFEEIHSLVSREIESLPETTKTIFILSRFRGFTVPEISSQLSLSGKAVEYHLTKALKYLRPRLTDYTAGSAEALMLVTVLFSVSS
jgi:RNA polymerase sigma-70 factor (ECF subfamily)